MEFATWMKSSLVRRVLFRSRLGLTGAHPELGYARRVCRPGAGKCGLSCWISNFTYCSLKRLHAASLMVVGHQRRRMKCCRLTQRPASATEGSSFLSRNDVFPPPDPSLLYECPVSNPSTNQANNAAPIANRMSPGTLIQRRVCMTLDYMNSEERAYQVPCSMDAQACTSPTGSMLRITMKIGFCLG